MKFLSLLLCIAVTGVIAQTNEISETLTVAGKTYQNAQIFKILSPTEGLLRHEGGAARIKLQDLPEPLRSKFYNEEKAKEFLEQPAKIAAEKANAEVEKRKRKEIDDHLRRISFFCHDLNLLPSHAIRMEYVLEKNAFHLTDYGNILKRLAKSMDQANGGHIEQKRIKFDEPTEVELNQPQSDNLSDSEKGTIKILKILQEHKEF